MKGDFLDEVIITCVSGKGGDGALSFRKEKYVPRGGPDGGDGGNGGNIIIRTVLGMNTLVNFKHKKILKADSGENGKSKKRHGKNGDNLFVDVPVGTIVYDYETNEIIADLKYYNQYLVVARGGKGGKGNKKFATSKYQVPKIFEKGSEGETVKIKLVLKLIADVGIIGFPNVGKSTFISKVSNAKPKIASYPFTTLIPNLGVVKLDEKNSFVLADIPGLIEGAHKGVGLGDDFLKHIERCHTLMHLIDVSGLEGRDPLEDYYKIRKELENFSKILSKKTEIVVLNKIDLISDNLLEKSIDKLKEKINKNILCISAYTNKNIDLVINEVWKAIEPYRIEQNKKIEKMLRQNDKKIKLKIDPIEIDTDMFFKIQINQWDENIYEISGNGVEKLLKKYDINETEPRLKILSILLKNGLNQTLKSFGIKDGDTVYIGDFAFEFTDE